MQFSTSLQKKRSSRAIQHTGSQADAPTSSAMTSPLEDGESSVLVQRARDYIQTNYSKPISLNEVASALDVNPAYLSSIFKSERGEPYSKYLLRLRMERAALLLRTHTATKIGDIACEVGYTEPSFTRLPIFHTIYSREIWQSFHKQE